MDAKRTGWGEEMEWSALEDRSGLFLPTPDPSREGTKGCDRRGRKNATRGNERMRQEGMEGGKERGEKVAKELGAEDGI